MECWTPDPEDPPLLRWWEPLLAVARVARADQVPWPIHIDEFTFAGRTDRPPRPAVWVYRHRVSEAYLLADEEGHTYEFVPYRSGPSRGRFKEISVNQAVWAAGLPNVAERIWYEYPDHLGDLWEDDAGPGPTCEELEQLAAESAARRSRSIRPDRPATSTRPRGHLRLVSGDDSR